jgi:hypothetical protein
MLLALFAFVIFQIGSHIFAWVSLGIDPPIYATHVAEMTGVYHHTQLSVEMGSHFMSWIKMVFLLISTF